MPGATAMATPLGTSLILAGVLATAASAVVAADPTRPNVIVILTDDQGTADLHIALAMLRRPDGRGSLARPAGPPGSAVLPLLRDQRASLPVPGRSEVARALRALEVPAQPLRRIPLDHGRADRPAARPARCARPAG